MPQGPCAFMGPTHGDIPLLGQESSQAGAQVSREDSLPPQGAGPAAELFWAPRFLTRAPLISFLLALPQ